MIQFLQNDQKDAIVRIIYCSLAALHISSDIFAHHQEHLNCNYSFWFYSRASLFMVIVIVSWLLYMFRAIFLLIIRRILTVITASVLIRVVDIYCYCYCYCFLTVLHVSSDIFAHHQENLNCNYSFCSYSRGRYLLLLLLLLFLDWSTYFERYFCSSSGES